MRTVNSPKTTPSQDPLWHDIEQRFLDFHIAIFGTRFATFEEAVGSPAVDEDGKRILKRNDLLWIDPEVGPVSPWLQIPFDDKRDIAEWNNLRETAEKLSEDVKIMLSEKNIGLKFALAWGQLSEIGRLFEYAWSSEKRVSAATKGSAIQSNIPKRVWYARTYISMEKPGRSRIHIDGDIAGLVEKIIKGNKFPCAGFDANWYRSILSASIKGELSASFQQSKMPRKKSSKPKGNSIEEFALRDCPIPPTDPSAYHL